MIVRILLNDNGGVNGIDERLNQDAVGGKLADRVSRVLASTGFDEPANALNHRHSAASACRRRAGFGAPTRRRRSESDIAPPSAIRTGPSQISVTSGIQKRRTTALPSLSISPSDT